MIKITKASNSKNC